jgi:hypothetical protein
MSEDETLLLYFVSFLGPGTHKDVAGMNEDYIIMTIGPTANVVRPVTDSQQHY